MWRKIKKIDPVNLLEPVLIITIVVCAFIAQWSTNGNPIPQFNEEVTKIITGSADQQVRILD